MDQTRPQLAQIRYECSLANILFATDYDDADLLTGGINLFSPHDSDNDVIQKLLEIQELCGTCGQPPADKLNQQPLALLRTFRFGDDHPKRKLMVFLDMQKGKNATTLLTASEEAIGRMGLSELASEGIYEININKALQSALIEVNQVLGMDIPDLTTEQESTREQIGVRIGQVCDDAKFDFQIDE